MFTFRTPSVVKRENLTGKSPISLYGEVWILSFNFGFKVNNIKLSLYMITNAISYMITPIMVTKSVAIHNLKRFYVVSHRPAVLFCQSLNNRGRPECKHMTSQVTSSIRKV